MSRRQKLARVSRKWSGISWQKAHKLTIIYGYYATQFRIEKGPKIPVTKGNGHPRQARPTSQSDPSIRGSDAGSLPQHDNTASIPGHVPYQFGQTDSSHRLDRSSNRGAQDWRQSQGDFRIPPGAGVYQCGSQGAGQGSEVSVTRGGDRCCETVRPALKIGNGNKV
jgi:hypothetical protein